MSLLDDPQTEEEPQRQHILHLLSIWKYICAYTSLMACCRRCRGSYVRWGAP